MQGSLKLLLLQSSSQQLRPNSWLPCWSLPDLGTSYLLLEPGSWWLPSHMLSAWFSLQRWHPLSQIKTLVWYRFAFCLNQDLSMGKYSVPCNTLASCFNAGISRWLENACLFIASIICSLKLFLTRAVKLLTLSYAYF